jgi:DNA primase
LGLNVETGAGHCFNCGWSARGTAILQLQRALRLGEITEKVQVKKKPATKLKLPQGYEVLHAGDKDYWSRKAHRYAKKRGISDRQIRKYGIGFTTVGTYRYRIILPVRYRGKLEGIVSRALTDDLEPRYKNSIGEKAIWGIPAVRARTAVLVEGVLDALACDRICRRRSDGVRLYDSLAVLGRSLTGRQLDMLRGYEKFILWPDPDRDGMHGFLKMRFGLRDLRAKVEIVKPVADGKDPDELSPQERHRRLRDTVELSDIQAQKIELWMQENL